MGHYIDAFRSYATFSGRAGRRAYWSFALFNFLFSSSAIVLDNLLGITIGGLAYGPISIIYGAGIALWFAVDRAALAMMEGAYSQSKRTNRG
jgi:uncharacterized membrane protein YhaH (DUF805 family)